MQCHYTEIVQRIFKHSDIQYISLTLDKKLKSLICITIFCVNIYGSYKLSKTVRFFWPTLYVYILQLQQFTRRMISTSQSAPLVVLCILIGKLVGFCCDCARVCVECAVQWYK